MNYMGARYIPKRGLLYLLWSVLSTTFGSLPRPSVTCNAEENAAWHELTKVVLWDLKLQNNKESSSQRHHSTKFGCTSHIQAQIQMRTRNKYHESALKILQNIVSILVHYFLDRILNEVWIEERRKEKKDSVQTCGTGEKWKTLEHKILKVTSWRRRPSLVPQCHGCAVIKATRQHLNMTTHFLFLLSLGITIWGRIPQMPFHTQIQNNIYEYHLQILVVNF